MAQTAVKVLFSHSHRSLEEQLNQWLEQVSGTVTITGISMDSNDLGHCLVLLYEDGGERHYYRGHVFFHRRHSGLEQEAHHGLTEAGAQWGRFVALGSNQHGHCLCVVEEY
jgi:hypothetical protein